MDRYRSATQGLGGANGNKKVCVFIFMVIQHQSVLVSYFGLFQRNVCTLPVDHAKGDALGLRRERPGDGGTGCIQDDRDGAVTAGLHEKLTTAVLKA